MPQKQFLPSPTVFFGSHLAFIGVDKRVTICDTSRGFVSFIVALGRGCKLLKRLCGAKVSVKEELK
jgi:hypothetical protein